MATDNDIIFDWADMAFGSKKPLKGAATFVVAPRLMSTERLAEIIKTYLPNGDIVFGVAKEPYISGFDGQPQFKTLPLDAVVAIAQKVAAANVAHKVYVLQYFQRDVDFIIEKLQSKRVVLVNGSWHQAFHTRSTYYVLARLGIPFDYVSPFTTEAQAVQYAEQFVPEQLPPGATGDESAMISFAQTVARNSFDTTFQTGCVLAKPQGSEYQVVASSYNRVIPYQAAALHHGSVREQHYSMPGDTSHYDTIHAEMDLLLALLRSGINPAGHALFVTTLPCPNCARTLSQAGLAEVVYQLDHSDGYAVDLFGACGIKTRRLQ